MAAKSQYQQAVEQAAAALGQSERADWEAARLTYENTRRGRNGGRPSGDDGKVSMEQWCADVQKASSVRLRFGPPTGYRYARIWQRYGLDNLSPANQLPNFKDAYREVDGTPDRERMMEYEGDRLLERGTVEQKARQAAALLRDEAVRQQALNVSTPLGGTVFGVAMEQRQQHREDVREAEERTRERTDREPVLKALDSSAALLDLQQACDDFATAVAGALPRVMGLPEASADPTQTHLFLREAEARARGALDQVAALIRTGRVGGDVDAFLKSVLEGGAKGS